MEKEAEKIEVGDVVRLKSNGPDMTVTGQTPYRSDVAYFQEDTGGVPMGIMQFADIPTAALKKIR